MEPTANRPARPAKEISEILERARKKLERAKKLRHRSELIQKQSLELIGASRELYLRAVQKKTEHKKRLNDWNHWNILEPLEPASFV